VLEGSSEDGGTLYAVILASSPQEAADMFLRRIGSSGFPAGPRVAARFPGPEEKRSRMVAAWET